MTTTAPTNVHVRLEHRRPAWVYAGVALLAGSVGLTWTLAGSWAALILLVLIGGATLALRSRRTRHPERTDDVVATETGNTPAGEGMSSADLLVSGLRRDLPRMAGLCRSLPSGGLPRAGLLAEHTCVVTDALRQLLVSDAAGAPQSSTLQRAEVAAQLVEVDRRAGRLHSSERIGGLDDLDWHLARLAVGVDEYGGDRHLPSRVPVAWSVSHRRRARILAWAAAANGIPMGRVGDKEALLTRVWLRTGISRRARRRAARLWGLG